MRFLLGVAEAGFFSGIILFHSWFPRHSPYRLGFVIGLPVAVAAGGRIDGAARPGPPVRTFQGWQVIYVAEAIPTVVVGVITFLCSRTGQTAKFAHRRGAQVARHQDRRGRRATEAVRTFTLWRALYNPKVLLLALNYLGILTASQFGVLIFMPQIIKSLGNFSNMTVGWLTMIPYICGAIAMVVWGRISDRMNERRWNLFIACAFSTVGLVIAGMTMGTWWALVGMSIAAMGFYGSKGPFFAMPPMFLGERAASRQALLGSTRSV